MLTRIFAILCFALGVLTVVNGVLNGVGAKTSDEEIIAVLMTIGGVILVLGGWLLDAVTSAKREVLGQLRAIVARLAEPAPPMPSAPPPLERHAAPTPAPPSHAPAVPAGEASASDASTVRYYYGDAENRERGPFSLPQMRQLAKSLPPTTPAYRSGSGAWATIADFAELAT